MAGNRLEGAALVTGAGSGIGRAVSVALTVAGVSTIYLTDISAPGLAETETIIANLGFHAPPHVVCISGDISSPEFVTSLFANIPQLHYAVNCAGVLGEAKPTAEVSLEDFDRVNGVNYRGLWLCVKEELKLMLQNDIRPYNGFTLSQGEAHTRGQRGSIVNIASQLGLVGKTNASAYTGSKAAVMSMTRSDALDYSKPPHYIRINSICPGVVATGMTTNEDGSVPERHREAINIAPMQRMGVPSEIADTAIFLCSGESSFITGHSLVVDGGYVIN